MPIARRMLVVVCVAGLACSEGTAPPVPSAIVVAGGNNQSALPGVTLALPLRVTVTGAAGAPFPGATVTWAVTAGSASLASPTSTTNASGEASVTVTIGVVPGNVVVTATVTGVAPASFQHTALDPCLVRVDIATNATANGVLTNFDCAVFIGTGGPFFTDFYRFTTLGQSGLQITLTAGFDAYLEQFEVTGPFIAFNDDLDSVATHSRVQVIAGAGTFILAASTFAGSVTGPYTLTVGPRTQTLTGCRGENFLPWLTRGVALTEQVETTDCTTIRAGGGRGYSDRVLIVSTTARPLAVTLASAAFNPRLELYEQTAGGPVLRTNADGAAGTATLNYTPLTGAIFRLEITSVDTVATGAYTLNVTGPTPGEAQVIALPFGAALPAEPRATRVKASPN